MSCYTVPAIVGTKSHATNYSGRMKQKSDYKKPSMQRVAENFTE